MQSFRLVGRLGRNGLATRLVRNFATESENKVYELRVYQMKPEGYRESLDLLCKYWSTRIAHSKPVGSWMTELGGICETVHLWEYDSLSDRVVKRQNVANDDKWRKEFLPKFFQKSHKLTCLLLKPRPGTEVITSFPPSESAMYELLNASPEFSSSLSEEGEIIVGQFETVYGWAEGEFTLYRYTDPDLAFERALQRRRDKKLGGLNRLLVPCLWSPIK